MYQDLVNYWKSASDAQKIETIHFLEFEPFIKLNDMLIKEKVAPSLSFTALELYLTKLIDSAGTEDFIEKWSSLMQHLIAKPQETIETTQYDLTTYFLDHIKENNIPVSNLVKLEKYQEKVYAVVEKDSLNQKINKVEHREASKYKM